MKAFRTPADIGNRALQHCGSGRMDPTLGFRDGSRNAAEVSFAYDKQRQAELRRRYWTCAIRRTVLRAVDTNTMKLVAGMWSASTTYFANSIVSDQSGDLWISNIANNLNNDPLLTTFWEPYFGPMTAALYDSTTTYSSGEVVYTTAGDGKSRIYLSLQDANSDNPATATAWDTTTTFFKNQVVTFATIPYMSLIDLNTNNEPDLAPALWAIGTTYAAGNKVAGSDGVVYQSIGSGNIGNDPTDGGAHWTNTGVLSPWTTVFTGGTGSDNWLQIGGAEFPMGVGLTRAGIKYPVGGGPASQSFSRNVFVLPAGYLRRAPQNPKHGINSLGGPSGFGYDDWLIENGYLTSSWNSTITLRFVADLTDVSRMDASLCEGLAARIAFAICDTITQDKGQLEIVAKTFKQWESDALTIDGIESGPTDDADDELILVRY